MNGKAGCMRRVDRRWNRGVVLALLLAGVGAVMLSWNPSRQSLVARPTLGGVMAQPVQASAIEEARGRSTELLFDDAVLIPEEGGPIGEIVLHYTFEHDSSVSRTYSDLFSKLSGATDFLVCCPSWEDAKAFMSRWGQKASARGREVVIVNFNRPLSLWSRDRRIARETLNHEVALNFIPFLSGDIEEEKRNELLLSSLLWQTGMVPGTGLISFRIEGGNLLGSKTRLFTGLNVFHENPDRFLAEEDLEAVLSHVFGLSPVLLRDREGEVPWPHADMYLTVIDEQTVLLADLVAGLELLDQVSEEEARPYRTATEPMVEREETEGTWTMQRSLDDIAGQLTEVGLRVVRVPALLASGGEAVVTYNNVLTEDTPEGRVVYMPIYELPILDLAMEEVYRRLGMEVRTVNVAGIYELGGAVRCVANVTRRYALDRKLDPRPARGTIRILEVDEPESPQEADENPDLAARVPEPISDRSVSSGAD